MTDTPNAPVTRRVPPSANPAETPAEKRTRAIKRFRYMRSHGLSIEQISQLIGCKPTQLRSLRTASANTLDRLLKVTPDQISAAVAVARREYKELLDGAIQRVKYMLGQGLNDKEIGALTRCRSDVIERLHNPHHGRQFRIATLKRVTRVRDSSIAKAVAEKRDFRKVRRPGPKPILKARAFTRLEQMFDAGLGYPEICALTRCWRRTLEILRENGAESERLGYPSLSRIASVTDQAIYDAAPLRIRARRRITVARQANLTYDEIGALAPCKGEFISHIDRGTDFSVGDETLKKIADITDEAIARAVKEKRRLHNVIWQRQNKAIKCLKYMNARNLTDREVATITGCSAGVVSNLRAALRSGQKLNPTPATCQKLRRGTPEAVDRVIAQRRAPGNQRDIAQAKAREVLNDRRAKTIELLRYMDDRGIELDEIAEITGISKETARRIISGKVPTPNVATVDAVLRFTQDDIDAVLAQRGTTPHPTKPHGGIDNE